MATRAASMPDQETDTAARQELERILASGTFRQVDRLKRFLRFVALEALQGRGDQLKEYVIGVQVFDKNTSFDPRADPIVRVQARRLRTRLARYYRDEGTDDAVVLDLPKGGYAPVFRPRDAGAIARRSLGAALAGQNTIAVLPFADLSAGRDHDYFCQGLRQEVIHRLARLEALRILTASPGDAAGASQRDVYPGAVALVVTGSVRKSGDRLRTTIHLVDNATSSYLWSESIDTGCDDIFAAQEAVADAVVRKLEPRLLDAGQRRGSRRPAENLAARNLYVQGRYHLSQRTDEGLHKALEFFEKAIVEDPQFAPAHSGLADAHGLMAHYGVRQPAVAWARAASSAAAAVMLDGNSAEAHTSLAHMKATQDWDWHGAAREFLVAIGLDPGYATAHHWYAMSCLVPMGRLDDALEEMRLAQSLDPVSSIVSRDLAIVHTYRREFDAALEQCDQTIELNPHFSPAYWTLGVIQEQRADLDEALAAFQRAIDLAPQSPRMHAALARTLALSGKRKLAIAAQRRLDAVARQRYVSPFEFATIRFALAQTDAGFESLQSACVDRAFDVLALKVDPRFDAIAGDSRFKAILSAIGLS